MSNTFKQYYNRHYVVFLVLNYVFIVVELQ